MILLRHWSLVARSHVREGANLGDQFVSDPRQVKFVQGELCSFGLFTSIMSTEQAMDECSANFGDGKFKEKLDKYGRPSNCGKVALPTVNPEIGGKLAHQSKRRDLHVATIQKGITKVGAILTGSASKIMATLADWKNSNINSNF